MSNDKKLPRKKKLHSRNRNKERFDLEALIVAYPTLANYIKPNKYGYNSIDFTNPDAVKLLNQSLLHHYYGIEYWDFPKGNLCPPIPGRADYIHYVADLLAENNNGAIPEGNRINCLDIGVGANCIYPILGVTEYDWNFIGSDIDNNSIVSAQKIIDLNPSLRKKIKLIIQKNTGHFCKGVLNDENKIDATFCNPPFHSSLEDAERGTRRKVKNLTGKKEKLPTLNFAGNQHELVYEGGEIMFVKNMILESKSFAQNCLWFTSLVSKQSNLEAIYSVLEKVGAKEVKTIPMEVGNKFSRIVAWTFLEKKEQEIWKRAL